MLHKRRRWEEVVEDDPAASLLNLFDVWIAFAAALLLAMASYYNSGSKELARQLEQLREKGVKIEHYRPAPEQLTGDGERLGTAYRLANGEVVYVPDAKQ
jgi:hypothetical protein